jgi:hypothetical protein
MVLNFNGRRWLDKCLTSVLRTDYPSLEICLVDNASTDGSVGYVQEKYPQVRIIQHPSNLGFGEGYNLAIGKVDTEYVILINNDTEVLNPSWVRELVNIAERDSKIAAVSCKMVSMEDHSRLDSVGGMGIPFWRGFVDIGCEEHDRGQYDGARFEPFAFCGGAALIKRDAFIRLGGFDGSFFLYVEDADLSWRLRLSGYHVAFAPEAKIAHYFSGSARTREVDPRKLYYCHRNLLRTILKNCGSSLTWALRNFFLFTILMIGGFSIYEPTKAAAVIRAILWNIANFKETYSLRLKTQTSRTENEATILSKMYPGLTRHQPSQHTMLRHALNILFEYSQLP